MDQGFSEQRNTFQGVNNYMTESFRINLLRLVFRSTSGTLHITASIEKEEERYPFKKFVTKRPRKVTKRNEDKKGFDSTNNHSFLNTYYESSTGLNKADTTTAFRELRV